MKTHIYPIVLVVIVALATAVFLGCKTKAGREKVSEFGKYQGYSEEIYDGHRRISDYLMLQDGTMLAYDLFLPTKKGVPADKPLPVLFKYTPYGRGTSLATGYAYPNMRANDAKGLTYTTPPLAADVRVAGHPIMHVWLSTDAQDLDLFAYLEEVDRKGNSTYISQGNLRASHRALSPAPFNTMSLPWRNHFKSELRPIPAGQPVELVFDLLPTAYRFAKGSRLRITFVCADADNFATLVIKPSPQLRLLRDKTHPSFIELAIAQAE